MHAPALTAASTYIGDITRTPFKNIIEDYHFNRASGPWAMFQVNDLVGIAHIGFNPLTDCSIYTAVMFRPRWDKVEVYACMCEVDDELGVVYPLELRPELRNIICHGTFTLTDIESIGVATEQAANDEWLHRVKARTPDYDEIVKRTQAHIEGELQGNAALQVRLAASEARVAALEAENNALRANARTVLEKEEVNWDKVMAAAIFGKGKHK